MLSWSMTIAYGRAREELAMAIRKAQLELRTRDDISLVRSAKQGEMAAFEELVTRHTDMILRVAAHITNSWEDAEDAVQEAFINAYLHLQHFEERSRFSTWLTRIAINEALGKLRRSRRVSHLSINDEADDCRSLADEIGDCRPGPEEIYGRTQLRRILSEALASLPDTYRIVFLMRDVEGLSTAAVSEALGVSVPSVKARLLRARLKLRVSLNPLFERRGVATHPQFPLRRVLSERRVA
jgi:RNA polymerase sigma-70 factor (ECF subfamily)